VGSLCPSKVGPGQLPVNSIEAKHCCPQGLKIHQLTPDPSSYAKSCSATSSYFSLQLTSAPISPGKPFLVPAYKQQAAHDLGIASTKADSQAKLSDNVTILPAATSLRFVHPSIHGALQLAGQGLQAGGGGRPRPGKRRALHQPQRQRSVLCPTIQFRLQSLLAFRAIQALELEVIRSGDPYASSDE